MRDTSLNLTIPIFDSRGPFFNTNIIINTPDFKNQYQYRYQYLSLQNSITIPIPILKNVEFMNNLDLNTKAQLALHIASAIVGTKSLKNGCNTHTDA